MTVSDGDTLLLGATKKSLESQIKARRLSGVLMLCGDDAGSAVDVATSLRLYPPDLGATSPDVISALEAGAKTVIQFEEGKPVLRESGTRTTGRASVRNTP